MSPFAARTRRHPRPSARRPGRERVTKTAPLPTEKGGCSRRRPGPAAITELRNGANGAIIDAQLLRGGGAPSGVNIGGSNGVPYGWQAGGGLHSPSGRCDATGQPKNAWQKHWCGQPANICQVAVPAAAPTTAGCRPSQIRGRYSTEELDVDVGVESVEVIEQASDRNAIEVTQRTPGVLPCVPAERLRHSTWTVFQVLNVKWSRCRPADGCRAPRSTNQLLFISIRSRHGGHGRHAAGARGRKREQDSCRRNRTRLALGPCPTLRGGKCRQDERFSGRCRLGSCRRHRRDCIQMPRAAEENSV